MSLQNSYVEALIPSVAIFADGVSKEVIKVEWNHKGRAPQSNRIGVFIRRDTRELIYSGMQGHSEKVFICKPEKELSPETHHADTLISDFYSPEL